MLISPEEYHFDFKGAKFDLAQEKDREFLGWVMNQALYGEATGIQCGYWLYRAPNLSCSSFIAKQATEEFSHLKRFLRILTLLGQEPKPASKVIRFMSTGMMGGTWGEHVAIEMAMGEGLVLNAFYLLEQTIDDPEIHKIIAHTTKEEESHAAFGERETQKWMKDYPGQRNLLLGSMIIQVFAMNVMTRVLVSRSKKDGFSDHPVLKQIPQFFDHVMNNYEMRAERMGVSRGRISEMSLLSKTLVLMQVPFIKIKNIFFKQYPLITKSYLEDEWVLAEQERSAKT